MFILKQDIPTHAHACRHAQGLPRARNAYSIKEAPCVQTAC